MGGRGAEPSGELKRSARLWISRRVRGAIEENAVRGGFGWEDGKSEPRICPTARDLEGVLAIGSPSGRNLPLYLKAHLVELFKHVELGCILGV